MTRRMLIRILAVALVGAALAAGIYVGYRNMLGPRTFGAIFTRVTGLYSGDEVRVSGVKVGTVSDVQPQGQTVKLTLNVDRDVPIPADVKAVIVQQNLVAARYVQLTPAYRTTGPTLREGSVIPVSRTAVPVEWDEVKEQLTRMVTELGPTKPGDTSVAGRFVDSAANAMAGNGDRLRDTLAQLSGVSRVLADGNGNIVDTIKNLQVFVTALRGSNTQIVQFEDRLATLSSVLDSSRTDLDAALTDLSVAVGDIQRFMSSVNNRTAESVTRLTDVTQTLVGNKKELEELLHVFPTVMSNFYNIYDPVSGTANGMFAVNGFSNPAQFVCGAIAGIQGGDPAEGAKKCAEYLGPALRLLNFNYLPIPVNPFLGPTPRPDQLIYSEAKLMPGYTGPEPPPPATLPGMLLPAEGPAS
ncbi:MCE family protein [Mycolicibacterium llatzerense]|uniref:Mammalian cell entry protein n=1 Tax=Mycolicibacterium llatzerense TaxID=280871 RepID=A0A0D1LMQ8_9MYCO|nr:MCE family protein [Mycolicibacterium llatzerense]KIU17166.1 mammalian cell entry protein [Mycolicibacterium llatzerense]